MCDSGTSSNTKDDPMFVSSFHNDDSFFKSNSPKHPAIIGQDIWLKDTSPIFNHIKPHMLKQSTEDSIDQTTALCSNEEYTAQTSNGIAQQETSKTSKVYQDDTKPILHTCPICQKNFTRPSNLTEHLQRHSDTKYMCQICQKTFSCSRYLLRHKRIHTNSPKRERITQSSTKTYPCTYCNKVLSCKSHLVAHIRVHTGEKPYACQVCSKKFNHKPHMVAHMRIHTNEKPYSCKVCGKKFRDASNMAGHMRVHTEKSLECSKCLQKFSKINELKKHELTHIKEGSYKCNVCESYFFQYNKLKVHLKTHEGYKNCICRVCGVRFQVRDAQRPYSCAKCSEILDSNMKKFENQNSYLVVTYEGTVDDIIIKSETLVG